MRDVAITADFVGGVHDHHAPRFGQHARGFAQQGSFADAGRSEQQDAAARLDNVLHDIDGAIHRTPDAAGQPDDVAAPISDRRDAMQRPLDA